MKLFRNNFLDIIKILFKIALNIPKLFYIKLKIYFSTYKKPITIIKNNRAYRDLYKNGKIEIYENIDFTPEQRASDLLKKMTIEEKAGQMFHPPISINGGTISEIMNLASGRGDTTESLILNKNITHYNLYGSPNPLQLAKKLNQLQKIAERSRLGIPLTISSDPIHEVPRGGGVAAFSLKGFSKWPSQLGFAATRQPEIIKEFAEIARDLGVTNTYLLVRPNLRRMANDMKRIGLNNQFLFQPGPYIEGFSEGGSVDIDVVEVQSEGLDLENYLLPEIETPPLAAQPMPSQQVINSALTQNNNLMNTGLTQTETALLSEEEKMLRLKQRNLA